MSKILLCNFCADDQYSKISKYLLETQKDKVIQGMKLKAERFKADELAVLLPTGCTEEFTPEITVYYGMESMITVNAGAAIEVIKGKLPRPTVPDTNVKLSDQELTVVKPEDAYALILEKESGAEAKIFFINTKNKSEIVEVAIGSKLSDVLEARSVTASDKKGILLGGIHGKFVKAGELSEYTIEKDSLFDSITFFEKEDCMVEELKKLAQLIQSTSCGKCVLCREGSLQYMTIVEDMTAGKAKMTDIDLIREISEIIEIGAYCTFGQKMPGLIVTGMELFKDEIEAHIKKKNCPTGVCSAFASYCILPKQCTGCEECLDACPEDAIEGKKGFIHMINEDFCTKCGKCVDACDEEAIIKVTGAKPKVPTKLTKVGKF
jgi:Na+-translocating ferredoxin:NAD+ oxidoreductase RNF subunit RnfB